MSDLNYPSSFDATPHTLNPPQLLPAAPILSAMARSRQNAGSRQFSMGANNFNFPNSHLTAGLNSADRVPRFMPPMTQAYAAQRQSAINNLVMDQVVPQNLAWNGTGMSQGDLTPRAAYQPNNQIPFMAGYDSMNNSGPFGVDDGEMAIGGSNMFKLTTPDGKLYGFNPSMPPPFIDLTRFVWPSNKPVVKITNVSLLPYFSTPHHCLQPESAAGNFHMSRLTFIKNHHNNFGLVVMTYLRLLPLQLCKHPLTSILPDSLQRHQR